MVVSNTPDVLTQATAELAIAMLLALLRRVAEGDRFVRRGEDWIWAPNMMLAADWLGSPSASSATAGSVMRSSGSPVAHGMEVVY